MYCPQCSQEQLAAEMRFCSRCGFPLEIVSQLVRTGGALAGFDQAAKGQLSPRQKGVRWGAILMIVSVLLVPVAGLMTAMKHDFLKQGLISYSIAYPALKCWAIFKRPLRGRSFFHRPM